MAVTAIAAFFPSVISKSIFAPRRANKSYEADAAPVSIMNAGIAAVQLAKMGEGISAIANEGKAVAEGVAKTEGTLKELSQSTSIFNDVKKFGKACVNLTNVNGCIGTVALISALYDDNPDYAIIQNGSMFGGMLAFEGAHKALFGKSNSSRNNGVNKIEVEEGFLYKNSTSYRNTVDKFIEGCEKQAEAWKDCGKVKKFIGKALKYVPSGIKGLSFAGFSIVGSASCYWLGGFGAQKITGKEKNKSKKAKSVEMNPSQTAKEISLNTNYRQAV